MAELERLPEIARGASRRDLRETRVADEERFEYLIGDLKAILVERRFAIASELIRMKHEIGDAIVTNELFRKFSRKTGELIRQISEATGIKKSELYYCVQFRMQYPELSTSMENLIPEKKTPYWSDIKKLLPTIKEKDEPQIKCRNCKLHCH